MGSGIGVGGASRPEQAPRGRRLVPMRVGSATVYVEQVGPPPEVEGDDRIHAVAPDRVEIFEQAGDLIQQCVRTIGDRMRDLGEAMAPEEITVEFSLTFEATGKAAIIPVFVTGETKAATGLKVTAVWKPGAKG